MLVRTFALILVTLGLMVPTAGVPAQADRYTPRAGVTFNSAIGDFDARRAIFRKILRSIDASPRGSEIKFFTWNFLTRDGTDALLQAQRRGVKVRVLMDDGNDDEIDNSPWRRLRAGLRNGNEGRPKDRRSWARVCENSCRGKTGSAHSKFFMFSQAGKARRVVMQGSANFTLASTNNQWNDMYTWRGNRDVWRFTSKVFEEAARDRKAQRPYAVLKRPSYKFMMFPNTGRNAKDPVRQLLNQINCRRATNTASGRTVIRIAPDVVRHERGMALARKVRELWNNGCDVRIGYTVMGITIGRMLRSDSGRGPVPMKHLVQDFDGDGEFDNYFHLKSMSVRGNVAGDRSNTVVLNGSANWSGLAKVSDENLGIYWKSGLTRRYEKHIDYWYENFPKNGTKDEPTTPLRAVATQDQLVFGAGRNAVYENGESVTDGEFDPFAGLEMD